MLLYFFSINFEYFQFPPIHHLETLERRFGHIFSPDIMNLFKVKKERNIILSNIHLCFYLYYQNVLRLYANDRLSAKKCIQHEAFISLNQKRHPHAHHRP